MLRKVKVENGWVEGLPAADPRITSFKGIPFAAPPVGENRWRAPQPVKDWDGILLCHAFGPIAMQAKPGKNHEDIYSREWNYDENIEQDEDCLQLNVWTPAKSADEKLPVFVWYYGGGLQVGNPAEMEFDGERLARRGLVVVTVNYRVNVFGFLCHPEITAEAPDAPANFGNLDQQAATRWVKRNIAAFGGNPDQITIGGQSAGGGSVMSQITSPQNEGLIQGAIIESGIMTSLYPGGRVPGKADGSLRAAEEAGVEFFKFLRVSTLAEARALPAEYIRDKAVEYRGFWGTVVDEKFCVGVAFDLFRKNQRLQIPVLFGHTSTEFPNVPNVKTVEEFKALAKEMFGEDADKFLALCPSQFDSVTELKKKASVSGIEYALRILCRANVENGANLPMYYYNFDPSIPGWDNPGTFHSVDLWFFFETLAKCWRPFTGKHYDLARLMCNYWANFIRSGDPNGFDADGSRMPVWEKFTPECDRAMYFGDGFAEFGREEPSELMKFLVDEFYKKEAK
ncbi:MAG: carboxylesterase family protein [Oscillospiraceae bacterium]|nr:carboxylesterase family protein [Oscillospiraceae bacterium]